MSRTKNVERAYRLAQERYAELGVDTEHSPRQTATHFALDTLLARR